MSDETLDDKSALCVPFILDRLTRHRQQSTRPFFVGINGIQGSGKTTLVRSLITHLAPHATPLSLSIDDTYLPHSRLADLRAAHPTNRLLQVRGQPGTHDLPLAVSTLMALREQRAHVKVPAYDKSAFDGEGDRVDEGEWRVVNQPEGKERSRSEPGDVKGKGTIDVVLLEGWCVGFRALGEGELRGKWERAKTDIETEPDSDVGASESENRRREGRLGKQRLEHLETVNEMLKGYDVLTDQLDAFIYLDAEDTTWVYDWRLEQEQQLRIEKGNGMTDEAVVRFVNAYFPAYELYSDELRSGVFPHQHGKQVNITLDKERKVVSSQII